MYTVLRFRGDEESEVQRFGRLVNDAIPNLYTGMDRVADRFSCSISSEQDWTLHEKRIRYVIGKLKGLIDEATHTGINVQVDIAIGPEDYHSRWLTELSFETGLLSMLGGHEIELVISIYRGDE